MRFGFNCLNCKLLDHVTIHRVNVTLFLFKCFRYAMFNGNGWKIQQKKELLLINELNKLWVEKSINDKNNWTFLQFWKRNKEMWKRIRHQRIPLTSPLWKAWIRKSQKQTLCNCRAWNYWRATAPIPTHTHTINGNNSIY